MVNTTSSHACGASSDANAHVVGPVTTPLITPLHVPSACFNKRRETLAAAAFFILHFASKRPCSQASLSPIQAYIQSNTMPNLLKDLVSMVSPQFKRPMQSPTTTNRLSPTKQNVASGSFSDFAARRENANAEVTVEQQQDQAKMDSFVFFNMMR
ncbi:hypothetical protein GN958_ATG15544 [Phytophthora infestans]|nr:hypothetical protein GN958_ATG15544 [Phytophthora infestans]